MLRRGLVFATLAALASACETAAPETAPGPSPTDQTPPSITGLSPDSAAVGIALNAAITATFSEPIIVGTASSAAFTLTDAQGRTVPGALSVAGRLATFVPAAALTPSTQYTATIAGSVQDSAGNSMRGTFSWRFSTMAMVDVTAPTVTTTQPASGATGVGLNAPVSATFSEPMTAGTLTTASVLLTAAGGAAVTGVVTVAGNTATLTPMSNLSPSTQYTATITVAAKDAAGNALASNHVWSFTTGAAPDLVPPTIAGNTPANSATNVAIGVQPTVTFSEPMRNATLTTATFSLATAAGNVVVPGTVTVAANTATFVPTTPLSYATQYVARITTGALDAAGNAIVAPASWSFTTAAAPDVTAPTITANTPANGATNVPITVAPTVTFSEPMQAATLTTASVTLRTSPGGAAVAGAVSISGNTVTFTPSAPLANGTGYAATVTTAAKDVAGNALAANASWTFQTVAAPVTSLVVSPTPVTVTSGATQQFTASGRRTGDPTTPVTVAVTWAATGGTITSSGLFTAGASAGSSYTVTATLTGNTSVVGQATVIVAPPAPVQVGVWSNVTPSNVDLRNGLSCGNFGTGSVQADPNRPSNLYAFFDCQGLWKSVDYGRTWVGPINTGTNGATMGDCAGGVTLAPNGTTNPPFLYVACIRGAGTGFWRSLDGGVSWTRYNIAPASAGRQDFYSPSVDPYDSQHLVMVGHEQDVIVESTNGGQTWTNVPIAAGMRQGNGTGALAFINTGNAATTRTTWLWLAQATGGFYGTWRTTNSGTAWTQVDKNEHAHGGTQLYQAPTGVLYMPGVYSALGWGVLRSTDYGVTWTHVGANMNQNVIVGTPRYVYGSYSYPSGLGTSAGPNFQLAPQPGITGWTTPGTPPAMRQGAAGATVTFDGTHYVIVTANYGDGLWMYIEP